MARAGWYCVTALPRWAPAAAWAVPVMVVGGFAMLAVAPLATLAVTVLRRSRDLPLRGAALALAAVYGSGLVVWALRDDPAPSLTKDLHPLHAAAVVVAGVVVAGLVHLRGRRQLSRS